MSAIPTPAVRTAASSRSCRHVNEWPPVQVPVPFHAFELLFFECLSLDSNMSEYTDQDKPAAIRLEHRTNQLRVSGYTSSVLHIDPLCRDGLAPNTVQETTRDES